ncbi:MAG: hypothetical protein H0W43_00660 [Chthoniobacterales bacterium]|nr:hypothetical protein [Chthoniobacterales bacterium]
MKTHLLLTAMLCALVIAHGAEPLEHPTGRFSFEQGIVLDYEIAPFNKNIFRQKVGRIGPVYGVDGGGAPSTELRKLVVTRENKKTPLEVSCMYEPAPGGMLKSQFRVRLLNARSMSLTGTFSDAAGSYVAQWLIVDGIGVRTILSDNPDTVSRLLNP